MARLRLAMLTGGGEDLAPILERTKGYVTDVVTHSEHYSEGMGTLRNRLLAKAREGLDPGDYILMLDPDEIPDETFPDIDFIARTPLIPGINADEEHIRAVLAFIRPYKNVIDYELLPYHRFGLGKYELLGEVYELDDYKTPSDDLVRHLQAIIDEAFGRSSLKGNDAK